MPYRIVDAATGAVLVQLPRASFGSERRIALQDAAKGSLVPVALERTDRATGAVVERTVQAPGWPQERFRGDAGGRHRGAVRRVLGS